MNASDETRARRFGFREVWSGHPHGYIPCSQCGPTAAPTESGDSA